MPVDRIKQESCQSDWLAPYQKLFLNSNHFEKWMII
jgi:hypothetical protein